eukprot:8785932-Prorocentrum_lima.AAC.1
MIRRFVSSGLVSCSLRVLEGLVLKWPYLRGEQIDELIPRCPFVHQTIQMPVVRARGFLAFQLNP